MSADLGGAGRREADAPDEAQTGTDRVYGYLRHQITTGKLASGARVDQRRVAQELGCSRMPVRAALIRLSSEGLLVTAPHVAARVAELSEAHLVEIYATRAALEEMLATEGAKRCGRAEMVRLSGLLADQKHAANQQDRDNFVALDRDFHRVLYQASSYGFACGLVEQLREMSLRYLYASAQSDSHVFASIDDHNAILEATLAHDYELVARLTKRHIDQGADVLISSLHQKEGTRSAAATGRGHGRASS